MIYKNEQEYFTKINKNLFISTNILKYCPNIFSLTYNFHVIIH